MNTYKIIRTIEETICASTGSVLSTVTLKTFTSMCAILKNLGFPEVRYAHRAYRRLNKGMTLSQVIREVTSTHTKENK